MLEITVFPNDNEILMLISNRFCHRNTVLQDEY